MKRFSIITIFLLIALQSCKKTDSNPSEGFIRYEFTTDLSNSTMFNGWYKGQNCVQNNIIDYLGTQFIDSVDYTGWSSCSYYCIPEFEITGFAYSPFTGNVKIYKDGELYHEESLSAEEHGTGTGEYALHMEVSGPDLCD